MNKYCENCKHFKGMNKPCINEQCLAKEGYADDCSAYEQIEEIEFNKPEKLTDPKHICYWYEKETGILLGGFKNKILNFLENDCIEETYDGWIVKPMPGYNATTHKIIMNSVMEFECSCQGFQKNGNCSHIAAVNTFIFKTRWNK